MDVKVYQKEEVLQPEGKQWIYKPSIIDLIPVVQSVLLPDGTYGETIAGCEAVEEYNDEMEQACSLATIWQRGLDPLDTEDGNRWSELYLGEINVVQIMEDLTESVQEVTPSVTVEFDTVTDSEGRSYLSYVLKATA